MTTQTYHVPEVSCGHCVKAITEELQPISGVSRVEVDVDTKLVTVEHDGSVTDAQLRSGIEAAGFDIAA
jgi:copper chaperone